MKIEIDDAVINHIFWNYLMRTRELETTQLFISKELVKENSISTQWDILQPSVRRKLTPRYNAYGNNVCNMLLFCVRQEGGITSVSMSEALEGYTD